MNIIKSKGIKCRFFSLVKYSFDINQVISIVDDAQEKLWILCSKFVYKIMIETILILKKNKQ